MHNEIFCKKCGKIALPDSKFCEYCGTRLDTTFLETREIAQQPQYDAPQYGQQGQHPDYQQSPQYQQPREPPMQTVRYGMTEDKPKSGKRMAELGKTLTVYLTLFIVVVVLLAVFWPIGIIAFLAWMYIIYKHRQGKRAR